MNVGGKSLALAALGAAMTAGALIGFGNSNDAAAFGNPRIIVNVTGTDAGTVEFQNVESFLPELLFDPDNGELIMPTNYCGLNVTHVGGMHWEDAYGNLVEAENHGEVNYVSGQGYMLMGKDITESYLGGVMFTGALDTCDQNEPWFFPAPLSYGGNGPQFGVQRLVLELDQPPSFQPTIEFLDHAMEPVELPDLYEDWEPPHGLDEFCEQVPEFCEPKLNPDIVPLDLDLAFLFGCWTLGTCDTDPTTAGPGFTIGCMAYSTGCDPDPQPIGELTTRSATPVPGVGDSRFVAPMELELGSR